MWHCRAFVIRASSRNGRTIQFHSCPPTTIQGTYQSGPWSVQRCFHIHDLFTHGCSQAGHPWGAEGPEDARSRAEAGFALLARQGRSWRRLSHLVDLAILDDATSSGTRTARCHDAAATKSTIADVGTDHGLLAMGLALTGRFSSVIGVDVSDLALKNGAFALLRQMENLEGVTRLGKENDSTVNGNHGGLQRSAELPIEFRLGNGLKNLEKGEANCICIAGMGVHRMIEILQAPTAESLPNGDRGTDLARIGCRQLILQPTNSRPRSLILLYDTLQRDGWRLTDERIEKLSSRWYVTAGFRKHITDINNAAQKEIPDPTLWDLPGSKLYDAEGSESSPMRTVLNDYIQFHKEWIHFDSIRSNQTLDADDKRWLERFGQRKLQTF